MDIFGLFMVCGLFIPVYLLLDKILLNKLRSFLICIGIGILLQKIYENSCDKIDYNYLVSKIAQINIFELLEKD